MRNYVAYLPPQDSSHALRLVGFSEYSVAIDFLDQFLSSATPSEIKVAEGIVAERPEFTIYTNLSRKWEGSGSFLSESGKDKNFAQRGLKWVTALARLE